MAQLGRQKQAAVIILAAPYRDKVTNPAEAALMQSYRTALRSASSRHGLAFLELPELTEAAYPINQNFFGELIHPNDMGHRLITLELLKLLKQTRALGDLNIPSLS